MFFSLRSGQNPTKTLQRVLSSLDPAKSIYGLGQPLTHVLEIVVPGLRGFPSLDCAQVAFPSTQGALWIQLRDGDRGQLQQQAQKLKTLASPELVLAEELETFVHLGGRDLSGYEDGTENPTGPKAVEAAIVESNDKLNGSSFVAIQRWVHDLQYFNTLSQSQRDHIIGRRISNNEEIEEAPPFAHVKRAAQESFSPTAFMVRRSMPWISENESGLLFIAFGESLDRFERVLRRMAGLEDGIVDGLLRFSRPVSGGYYWCPPAEGYYTTRG